MSYLKTLHYRWCEGRRQRRFERQNASPAALPETFLDQLRTSRRLASNTREVSEMSDLVANQTPASEIAHREIKRAPIIMIPAPERPVGNKKRRLRKIEEEISMSNPVSVPDNSVVEPVVSSPAEIAHPEADQAMPPVTMKMRKEEIFQAYSQLWASQQQLLADNTTLRTLNSAQGIGLQEAALWYSPEKWNERETAFTHQLQQLDSQLTIATDYASEMQTELNSQMEAQQRLLAVKTSLEESCQRLDEQARLANEVKQEAENNLETERTEKNALVLRNRDLENGAARPKIVKRIKRRCRFWQFSLIVVFLLLLVLLCFPNLTPVHLELLHHDRRVNTVIWNGRFNLNLDDLVVVEPKGQTVSVPTSVPLAVAAVVPTATPAPLATAASTFGVSDLLIRMNGVILNLKGWQNVVCDPSLYEIVPQLQVGWTSYVINWKTGLDFADLLDFTSKKNR
ncbi:MAG: hypothetical protein Q4G02_01315 [bacterium]|nr:hypothetical protein [bacterium]